MLSNWYKTSVVFTLNDILIEIHDNHNYLYSTEMSVRYKAKNAVEIPFSENPEND